MPTSQLHQRLDSLVEIFRETQIFPNPPIVNTFYKKVGGGIPDSDFMRKFVTAVPAPRIISLDETAEEGKYSLLVHDTYGKLSKDDVMKLCQIFKDEPNLPITKLILSPTPFADDAAIEAFLDNWPYQSNVSEMQVEAPFKDKHAWKLATMISNANIDFRNDYNRMTWQGAQHIAETLYANKSGVMIQILNLKSPDLSRNYFVNNPINSTDSPDEKRSLMFLKTIRELNEINKKSRKDNQSKKISEKAQKEIAPKKRAVMKQLESHLNAWEKEDGQEVPLNITSNPLSLQGLAASRLSSKAESNPSKTLYIQEGTLHSELTNYLNEEWNINIQKTAGPKATSKKTRQEKRFVSYQPKPGAPSIKTKSPVDKPPVNKPAKKRHVRRSSR